MNDLPNLPKDAALSQTAGVAEAVRSYLMSNDLYSLLTDIQNGIDSPATMGTANSLIVRLDRLRDMLAAAPAASGGENKLTRAEAIAEFRSRTAASVSERARELGEPEPIAWFSVSGYGGSLFVSEHKESVERWITEQNKDQDRRRVSPGYRHTGPFPLIDGRATPQPSADAVRAIGWLNSDGSSYLPTEKRARMIEAGKREGASVGEVTFGKIAEDHRIALYAAPPSVACLVTAWRDRINVDPEDPYEHGESDALMSCADELESLLSAASGEGVG